MSRSDTSRGLTATAAALAILALALALALALDTNQRASATALLGKRAAIITPHGVGQLHLGATVASLHRRHLIRGLHPGCELDPGQRVARLRPPLKGFAVFAAGKKRLTSIAIDAGAETVKHIGIGSTPKEARAAYPNALYKPPGSLEPFAEGFLFINNIAHPKMTFIFDSKTHLISEIDVPAPNFCE
jgi:hypothetical protein